MFVWLAKTPDNQTVAFANATLSEYLQGAPLLDIPVPEPSCRQILIWSDRPVPVIRTNRKDSNGNSDVMVLRTSTAEETEFVGLVINGAPRKMEIEDNWFDSFNPEECGIWSSALISGFHFEDQSVPIIDPNQLCTKEFLKTANSAQVKQLPMAS